MEKSKQKNQSISTITYYWNRALFARSFEIITDLTPEACARRLKDIDQPRQGIFNTLSRKAKVERRVDRIFDFDIRIRRNNRGTNYTTVKATGVVIIDRGLDQTVVRGDIRLGWVYASFMVLSVILALIFVFQFILFTVFILITIIYYVWTISVDYQRLVGLIDDAIR